MQKNKLFLVNKTDNKNDSIKTIQFKYYFNISLVFYCNSKQRCNLILRSIFIWTYLCCNNQIILCNALQNFSKKVSSSQYSALWCFDGTLNPALNWLYLLMRPTDLNQTCTIPRSGQDPGLVIWYWSIWRIKIYWVQGWVYRIYY